MGNAASGNYSGEPKTGGKVCQIVWQPVTKAARGNIIPRFIREKQASETVYITIVTNVQKLFMDTTYVFIYHAQTVLGEKEKVDKEDRRRQLTNTWKDIDDTVRN